MRIKIFKYFDSEIKKLEQTNNLQQEQQKGETQQGEINNGQQKQQEGETQQEEINDEQQEQHQYEKKRNDNKHAQSNDSNSQDKTTEELEEIERNRQKSRDMFEQITKPRDSKTEYKNDFTEKLGSFNVDEVLNSTIKILLEKFFETSFSKISDLNKTRSSSKVSSGIDEWDIKGLITHRVSKNYQKMLTDKTGYLDKNGDSENIPLAFYFDLSGSMNNYVDVLTTMAYQMLKHKVRIILGFNQNAMVQINSIPDICTPDRFKKIMVTLQNFINAGDFGNYCSFNNYNNNFENKKASLHGAEVEFLKGILIDEYLIRKKSEKVVVFSDLDPENEICSLSKKCKVYWFCFLREGIIGNIDQFKGNFFRTVNKKDILNHLRNMDNKLYEKNQRKSMYREKNYYDSRG